MKKRFSILFVSCFLLTINNLYSSDEKLVIEWADSLVGSMASNAQVQRYAGNVRIKHKDIKIFCDIATEYLSQNRAELISNVKMHQDNMVLTAPRADYDAATDIATANNGVKIVDGGRTLIADRGKYSTETLIADFFGDVYITDDSADIFSDKIRHFRENQNSFAYGNVVVKGKFTDVILTGDSVEHYPTMNYTLARGNPVLFKIDTLDESGPENNALKDTMSISCLKMEAFRGIDFEYYEFTDSVEIVGKNITAKCSQAVYDKYNGMIILKKFPVVWYDSTQLFGDSTVVLIEDEKINKIVSFNNAFAASKDDTIDIRRINQIAGDIIEIDIDNNKLTGFAGYGNTKSLYYMSDEETSDGADQKVADTIKISFGGGQPEEIIWLGGVVGKYYPENIVSKSPEEYYLPDFRIEKFRPSRKIFKGIKNKRIINEKELLTPKTEKIEKKSQKLKKDVEIDENIK